MSLAAAVGKVRQALYSAVKLEKQPRTCSKAFSRLGHAGLPEIVQQRTKKAAPALQHEHLFAPWSAPRSGICRLNEDEIQLRRGSISACVTCRNTEDRHVHVHVGGHVRHLPSPRGC
jgi:hypothetical protein